MTPSEALIARIRKIVAESCGRSYGGTKAGSRLRAEINPTADQQREISWRIRLELGVEVPAEEWMHFDRVEDLIRYVQLGMEVG